MGAATVQAIFTLLLAAGVGAYVWISGGRSPLRRPLLYCFGATALWAAGVIVFQEAVDERHAFAGFTVGWVGAAALPVHWLWLAARFARVAFFEQRAGLARAALLAPVVLSTLALLTNSYHGLFLVEFDRPAVSPGPLYYAYMPFAYGCAGWGLVLFLRAGGRVVWRRSKLRGSLLCAGLLLPVLSNLLFLTQWVAFSYDPTPTVLALTVVLVTATVLRRHLLDTLPLTRRDLIDHLRDGVLIADAGGTLIDANPAAQAILGCSLEAIQGRRLAQVFTQLRADGEDPVAIQERFEGLAPDAMLEPTELHTADNRLLQLTAKSIPFRASGAVGRFAVLRDRTQENRYELFARQAQRLETVAAFAAGIAHEVNNPLAFLRSNLYHLEQVIEDLHKHRDQLPPAEASALSELPDVVAECVQGIDRIGRTVDSMRRFSRTPPDDLTTVDVNELLAESIRLADLHRSRHVAVSAQLAEGLPAVHGSSQRLSQVFVNLLVNARQALADRETGQIWVESRREPDFVHVEVRDNGPGIPEELHQRVFDPFFTTKGPDEGTGLGLAISCDIVREHGGVLQVRAAPEGGACFVVHLPTQAAPRRAARAPNRGAQQQGRGPSDVH